MICERNIDQLPPAGPQLGPQSITKARALTRSGTGHLLVLGDDAQPTDLHQSGRVLPFETKVEAALLSWAWDGNRSFDDL